MSLNSSLGREEYLKKKRNKKFIKYSFFIISFCLLIGLLSYVSHRPKFRIAKTELSGGVLVTQDEISENTNEFLNGSYLFLFPKNNILLYPRKSLIFYLKNKFQRIDTIDIYLKNWNTLNVEIAERKPKYIWCKEENSNEVIELSKPKCYFLDLNGTIFSDAPDFSGDAYFKYYGLVTLDNPIGTNYIASTTQFKEISNFVDAIKMLSLRPMYLVAKEDGGFSLVISDGGKIYFDMEESLLKVENNLKALLLTPELSKNISNIDYIDLRFGNKLFYKLK